MQPEEQISQEQNHHLSHVGQNFLTGLLLGLVPLFLSFLYWFMLGDSLNWDTLMTKFFVILPILCGILSAAFGKRFVVVLGAFMSHLG